jgi:purine-cytosine permease-like protein
MVFLWVPSAILGLVLAEALNAGPIASVGLVAGVGIIAGLLWAAWSQLRNSK